jgi:YesN/AraC family two-component response regulator
MLDNLLLIDDDEITHLICEMVIKKENLARHISKLKNGKEGIDYFKELLNADKETRNKKAPKLILLDLNMPVMNGWDFLEEFSAELEKEFPETKVCILTSSVDPFDFSHSKIYNNVIGFISKPLTEETVHELKMNEQLASNFNY